MEVAWLPLTSNTTTSFLLLVVEMIADRQVITRAEDVLARFLRWCIALFRTRRTVKSLVILTKAFKNASQSRSTSRTTNRDTLVMMARRDELSHRYATSLRQPPSPEHRSEDVVVKSTYDDRHQGSEHESSDDEEGVPSRAVDTETYAKVINHLHNQLNRLEWENAAKSSRIDELEALVAMLTQENCELRSRQHEWTQLTDGTEPSNQTRT